MAYDARRHRVVLFGGHDGVSLMLGDTWEWDGTTWLQRHPTNSPTPRAGTNMTYDRARERVILFGGHPWPSPIDNVTWEWNGSDWRRLAPVANPNGMSSHSMCYDHARDRVVVFGGETYLGRGAPRLTINTADVWELRPPLESSPHTLPLADGGQIRFRLTTNPSHAGQPYLLLGSLHGTAPGVHLGPHLLPLNPDPYFTALLFSPNALIQGSVGILDARGVGSASMTIPPGLPQQLAGITLHHAFAVFTPGGFPALYTSNAEPLLLQ